MPISCLCVLPTKDLASQVYEVFLSIINNDLRVALLSGERSFVEEEFEIQNNRTNIIVCTPGRLRDHLQSSLKGDALKKLRYLVIDEGDRLLSHQYHQWITDLMPCLNHPVFYVDGPFEIAPLQKLVFSATMTSNPRKLALLNLYRPTFFHAIDSDDGIKGLAMLPSKLSEYRVLCSFEEDRPLVLMWLIMHGLKSNRNALVFLNSVDRAHTLYSLISPILSCTISLYTSRVILKEREDALNRFKEGKVMY